MPYALFSNDAKLSKTYPTEADVWKVARKSGLVIDVVSEEAKAAPCPVLENDYEIRPCSPDPHEDPAKNQADAERESDRPRERPRQRGSDPTGSPSPARPARKPAIRKPCGDAAL